MAYKQLDDMMQYMKHFSGLFDVVQPNSLLK